MAKIIKKIFPQSTALQPVDRLKVLVFATDHLLLKQIAGLLEKKNVLIWLVSDERKLSRELEQADPELILMQLNATTIRPLDQIVADVFVWMRKRARAINKLLDTPSHYLWQHSKVVLFEGESQITPTGSLSAQIADTDEMIRLCQLLGDVKYIGEFSSYSFMSKMRPFLEDLYE